MASRRAKRAEARSGFGVECAVGTRCASGERGVVSKGLSNDHEANGDVRAVSEAGPTAVGHGLPSDSMSR